MYHTTVVWNVDGGEGCVGWRRGGISGNSVYSAQFCYESKSALKLVY